MAASQSNGIRGQLFCYLSWEIRLDVNSEYREITLLPVITKILFTILAARISTWAEYS